ncbi:uncharacterized protein PV06_09159 [Exophiala oligosperma]|uniref:Uncharacterized protein n=1 Tax=Exophiala oligosperma TaxID=215243 RepID=A0A0D2DV12_9EURO|nr:uncharacterized protein PV06_09159 [Exophiala oligosperma]KIW39384.1 hypothetical protein PV06_09159 [Exophiala oligosperma]
MYMSKVVRVGPDELSYVTEQAWADIYKTRKGGTTNSGKQLQKFMPRPPGFQHGLMDNPFDDEQAVCRKALVAGMNDRSVRMKESTILQKNVGLLIEKMKMKINTSKTWSTRDRPEEIHGQGQDDGEEDSKEGEGIIDLANCLECVAMDVIGDFVSGETFGCLDNLELNPLFDKIVNSLKQLAIGCGFESCRLTKPIVRMGKPRFDTVVEIRRRLERREQQQQQQDNPKSEDDILYHVFKDVETSKGLGYKNLAERVAADAITGGFDTIAIAMVGAMYFLVKNPEKMKILRDEIRGTFETDDEITLARVNSLPYLTAVFSETLRLWPPGPETLRRVTNGPGGNIIDGEWVPPNTLVGVYHWTAGRYKGAWTDADEFVPERWFDRDNDTSTDKDTKTETNTTNQDNVGGRYKNDKRGVVNSFQLGPRNCPGQSLANAEFRLVITHLIWNFDVEAASAQEQIPDWSKTKIFGLVAEKRPLTVKLRLRKTEPGGTPMLWNF